MLIEESLTFKNSKVSKEVLKNIPLERIVFETDAPYLSPTPYRGQINLPKYIFNTIKYASEILNINLNELEKITFNKLYHKRIMISSDFIKKIVHK